MDISSLNISNILDVLAREPIWAAILFLILSFTAIVWTLSRRQASLNEKINTIDGKIDQLTKAVSSTTLEMTNVKTAVGGVEDTLTGVNKVAEDTKRDVASLTDGISGETQVSSAIEMAREGASIEKIVAVTGISKEEAEAVVRFHKPES
tara:strand:+ start:1725 stop:2174 length:450 start_codon:yes stop_codon:yes gene_type:complete